MLCNSRSQLTTVNGRYFEPNGSKYLTPLLDLFTYYAKGLDDVFDKKFEYTSLIDCEFPTDDEVSEGGICLIWSEIWSKVATKEKGKSLNDVTVKLCMDSQDDTTMKRIVDDELQTLIN